MRKILRKFLGWVVKEDVEESLDEPERLPHDFRRLNELQERLGALENYLGVYIQKQYGFKVVKKSKSEGLTGAASAEKMD